MVTVVVPVPHFYEEIEGGFWYETAYRKLLDELPTDRPTTWVEVGVFHGKALAWLGVEIINRGLPVSVRAVDPFFGWPGTLRGAALRDSFCQTFTRFKDHGGWFPEVCQNISIDAATTFIGEVCDVVWLDANHSYAAVTADCAAWWSKVRPGGVLGGDDWDFDYDGFGVRRAVEAFAKANGLRVETVTGRRHGELWRSWLIRKPVNGP